VTVGDNDRLMSQERSQTSFVGASLFLAIMAYVAGLVAMGAAQTQLIGKVRFQIVLIVSEMALALPALVVMGILAARIPELFHFRPLVPFGALKTGALGLALWGLSLGVFEAQYVFVKPPLAYLEQFQGLHELLRPAHVMGFALSIVAIAVAPAICEEIVFRGLLTPVLNRAAGALAAMVVSGALFAVIHIDTMRDGTSVYYRLPFAFLLGALLARLRLDTGSLWPPVIAHATLNATTFLVVLLIDEPKGVLPEPRPLIALGMLVVGSVVARLLMRSVRTGPAPSTA
jgi:membrane protease YdiL (CAAX protease family)